MSWYKTGFDGVKQERERIFASAKPDRFWMTVKQPEVAIVFIDDDPFSFREHGVKMKDGRFSECTCISAVHPDNPACCKHVGNNAHYVGMFTVLDCTARHSKKDPSVVYQYDVKLFAAKVGTLETLARKRMEHTSLVNLRCLVHRDTDKSPNVGSEFTFKDEIKGEKLDRAFDVAKYRGKRLAELFDEAERDGDALKKLSRIFKLAKDGDGKLIRRIPPFNYEVVCAPMNPEEMARWLGDVVAQETKSKGPSGGFGGGGGDASGAPF